MKTTVGRTYRFRAVHSLPGWGGPASRPHEHDYTVEIVARGGTPTEEADQWWAHAGIASGEAMDDRFLPSTVENIAETLLAAAPEYVIAVVVHEDRQRWGKAER